MDNTTSDKNILANFGGPTKNDLSNIIDDKEDENSINIGESHYVALDEMPAYVQSYAEGFSVLSINMQSIGADGKFDQFKCILNHLESKKNNYKCNLYPRILGISTK